MNPSRFWLIMILVLALVPLLFSQGVAPPASRPPDDATLKEITSQTGRLGKTLASLKRQGVRDPWLADVEIYYKAATWIVRHNEFYDPHSVEWTLEALNRGFLRASQAARGESPWTDQTGHAVLRAYRSRVDGSVQPYGVTLPADFGKDPRKRWRLDVVLHGRDPDLNEVKFLHHNNGDQPAPKEQDFVRLDIYGRGNNAYRWAGETDVEEAENALLANTRLAGGDSPIDPLRVVLRGFSMGGAGTWHLGLHHPDRWCVLGPGAGFVVTHGFVKDLPDPLPPYQEACLHVYDAADYAENAFNLPVVAYGGAKDPQLQAARTIEERLKPLHIPMKLLVAPDLAHTFPPEWQHKAEEEYLKYASADKGRDEYPGHLRFVTYTLRYPSFGWVEVLGLERHYARTVVDAEKTDNGFTVKTENARALRLGLQAGSPQPLVVHIDGDEVHARPYLTQAGAINLFLARRDAHWKAVLPQRLYTEFLHHWQKMAGVQGPIDDAFMESFLCVRGTEKAWHEATQTYAEENLKRFRDEWSRYLRGDLPVKDDVEVTEEDMAGKHLVLFGDPGSNSLIAQVLDGLPLQWTPDHILMGGKTYDSAGHVPVLIYPNPLSAGHYVVLNSGHTFHAADFQGTNALLYPRLGDYAVLKLTPTDKDPLATEVVTAGLFDDFWQPPPEK